MLVSYNWLQEYFKEKLPKAKDLADILNTRAYEVEGIKEIDNDFSIDIDVLPNRAHDSLCHRGIAKEISVNTGLEFFDKDKEVQINLGDKQGIEVVVDNEEYCKRYCALVIENVEVKDSDVAVKNKLKAIEQKSINNIVDFTNIVMYEMGQPLHAFDKDKIKGKIIIRNAEDGEKITTLDNKEVTLETSILIIADEEGPLAIAGVKGGKKAEVTKETKNIILEAANFDASLVRRASLKVNIKTDSSKRFENEINPVLAEKGIKMVAGLILQNGGGEIGSLIDIGEKSDIPYKVNVSLLEINSLLGTDLNEKTVESILKKLDFSYENNNGQFTIVAPLERLDLRIKEDVIEEIGRIYGYENIEGKPIEDNKKENNVDNQYKVLSAIKNILFELGFSEVITSSFREEGEVATIKPVALDKKYLRTNLKDSIEQVVKNNTYSADLLGLDFIKIFEIGNIFTYGGEDLHLCLAVSGNKVKNPKASEFINQAIGQLNKILDLDIKEINADENILEIVIKDRIINSSNVEGANVLLPKSETRKYQSFSLFPFVLRDIAVWVPENISTNELQDLIKDNAGDLLINIKLFDEYKKDGKNSYAYRLVFQSFEKTLTDDEVNEVMKKVNQVLEERGWEVR